MVTMLGVILIAGCHDRRADVKTPLGDGVELWGKTLPYDHWQFNFFHPKNLPALVTMVYLEDGDIRESISGDWIRPNPVRAAWGHGASAWAAFRPILISVRRCRSG